MKKKFVRKFLRNVNILDKIGVYMNCHKICYITLFFCLSLKPTFAPIWLPHCPACRWTISLMLKDYISALNDERQIHNMSALAAWQDLNLLSRGDLLYHPQITRDRMCRKLQVRRPNLRAISIYCTALEKLDDWVNTHDDRYGHGDISRENVAKSIKLKNIQFNSRKRLPRNYFTKKKIFFMPSFTYTSECRL